MRTISDITKKEMIKWIVTGIIFLVTFPFFSPVYGIGLDSSYVWGLNWLFINDYQTLINLSYPLGPLAFLRMPAVLGNNFLFFILFYGVLKVGFIYLMFKLSDLFNVSRALAISLTLTACFFANVDFLMIGSCLILNLLFHKKNDGKFRLVYLFTSAVLASLALFIKVSIGISCLTIIFMSLLIDYYHNRNTGKLLKHSGVLILIGFVIGLAVFQGFAPLFKYVWGTLVLSGGYGGTLSLHPPNNWFLLSLFLILMLSFPFWNKEKDVRIACLLSLFPFYASWKHAFIREDISHYTIIISFLFVFWGIMLIVSKKKRIFTYITASCTLLLLYANMSSIPMYKGINKEVIGINNFVDVLHYRDFKQKNILICERNIAPNTLNEEQKNLIGNKTIDAYPWEFSYIAANGLNWKPRRTLSLELKPSFLSKSTHEFPVDFCQDAYSPDFLLFHYQSDRYGNNLSSLDDRHIFNDEPLIIHNIFDNYILHEKTDKFMLFKRDSEKHFEDPVSGELQQARFDEWIELPDNGNEIVRLKVFSKNTLWGILKKTLYKEGEYYIDYMLNDGTIFTHRYVAVTAGDGLWCQPFVRNPQSDVIEPDVKKVRLRNSDPHCVSSKIDIQFEKSKLKSSIIAVDTTISPINNFLFHKTKKQNDSIVYQHFQDFENLDNQSPDISNLSSSVAGHSNIINKGGGAYAFEIKLDSIWQKTDAEYLSVEANMEFLNYSMDAILVLSMNESDANFWEIAYLPLSINKNLWHYAYLDQRISRAQHGRGIMKVYVLNSGGNTVNIDDFRLTIKK